jgi:hypothetical protein
LLARWEHNEGQHLRAKNPGLQLNCTFFEVSPHKSMYFTGLTNM